jgi:hypothetical protein
MAVIGHGYGSEWQMLRYLGRHRRALTAAVAASVGCAHIDWLDFPFDAKNRFYDAEWKGLDFLPLEQAAVREHWHREWPQTGNVMNWDAVGWANGADGPELILVEAKSHLAEVNSECGAKEIGGRPKIRRFLDQAKQHFGVPIDAAWLKPHYQYCNRLAMLAYLRAQGIPAHLVFLYFTGDCVPGAKCPPAASGWQQTLTAMKSRLQLPPARPMEHVHEVFLPVVTMPESIQE